MAAVKKVQVVRKSRRAKKAPQVRFGENYLTSQVYSQGLEFAFVARQDGVYKQACTFVYCKDFLHDAVWATINRKPWSIYGFKYNPTKDLPVSLSKCILAMRNTLDRNKPERFHQRRPGCLDFLRQLEKQMEFKPSRIWEVPHEAGPCWLIVGDKKWQHAPPLVGLYTLLIRLGCQHAKGDKASSTLEKARSQADNPHGGTAGDRDSFYLKKSWQGLQLILKHGINVFHSRMRDNYPASLGKSPHFLHNHFGPVKFTENANDDSQIRVKEAMPYWYRPELWNSE